MVSEHASVRAVFLDRDGVLTVPEFRDSRSCAPRRLENVRLYAEAADSAVMMKKAGFRLVVVTNQAGRAAGCTTIFIDLGYADEYPERPDFTVASRGEAAKVVLRTA